MYPILICDDDNSFNEYIKNIILSLKNECVSEILTFNAADSLLFWLEDRKGIEPIIFLDIKLNEINGIDLAETILKNHKSAQIIFISGFDNYFVEAYKVEHIYFLSKPIKIENLKDALKKAVEKLKKSKGAFIFVSRKKEIVKIELQDILYIEKNKRLAYIHEVGRTTEFYEKLEEIEKQLTANFVRCHNSYIVNLNKVTHLKNREFYLKSERIVPISQNRYKFVKENFFEFLSESGEG